MDVASASISKALQQPGTMEKCKQNPKCLVSSLHEKRFDCPNMWTQHTQRRERSVLLKIPTIAAPHPSQ